MTAIPMEILFPLRWFPENLWALLIFHRMVSFTYTPNDGASGAESIEYTISDGYNVATATLTITIEPNNPPVAVDDNYTTGFNESLR